MAVRGHSTRRVSPPWEYRFYVRFLLRLTGATVVASIAYALAGANRIYPRPYPEVFPLAYADFSQIPENVRLWDCFGFRWTLVEEYAGHTVPDFITADFFLTQVIGWFHYLLTSEPVGIAMMLGLVLVGLVRGRRNRRN